MIALGLFDGMSGGQIALTELGFPLTKYYSSEVDKFANQQIMLNFPNTVQLGSVTDVDVSKLEPIDLLLGGSPCFTAGTQVVCVNDIRPIEDIKVGDIVLTHTGCYKSSKKSGYANIVIEKSEMVAPLGCVLVTIGASNCMEIHLELKTKGVVQKTLLKAEDIMGVRIRKKDTNQQWKVTLGGALREERLSTILTLINWITQRRICTFVKHRANILFCIRSLSGVEQNCLNLVLSDLRVESILPTSATQQYKMLGNGWTIEVIKHILSYWWEGYLL